MPAMPPNRPAPFVLPRDRRRPAVGERHGDTDVAGSSEPIAVRDDALHAERGFVGTRGGADAGAVPAGASAAPGDRGDTLTTRAGGSVGDRGGAHDQGPVVDAGPRALAHPRGDSDLTDDIIPTVESGSTVDVEHATHDALDSDERPTHVPRRHPRRYHRGERGDADIRAMSRSASGAFVVPIAGVSVPVPKSCLGENMKIVMCVAALSVAAATFLLQITQSLRCGKNATSE